jgi:error-prone DNA polymerase
MAEGRLQREGEVIHIIVKHFINLTPLLRNLTNAREDDLPLLTLSRADERQPGLFDARNKRSQVRSDVEPAFPPARNFR